MGLFDKKTEFNYLKVVQEVASGNPLVSNVKMNEDHVSIDLADYEAFIIVSPNYNQHGDVDFTTLYACYPNLHDIAVKLNVSDDEAYVRLGQELNALVPHPEFLDDEVTLSSFLRVYGSEEILLNKMLASLIDEMSFVCYTIDKMINGGE